MNSGQTCSALTRMIVPRSRLAEVEELARRAAEAYVVGDPFAEGTTLGPLVSAVQRERVRGYIEKGLEEGATLVTGGADAPEGLERGFFVKPTVFSNVTTDMTIAQEEIFGPVLVIMPYDTDEEAVEIANDTVYGLAGAVSGSDERAKAVARKIRAGQVRVNAGRLLPGRAVRRLQAVGPRARARQPRARGVPRGEGALRLMDGAASKALVQEWFAKGITSPAGQAMVTDDFRWIGPPSMAELFGTPTPHCTVRRDWPICRCLDKALYRGYQAERGRLERALPDRRGRHRGDGVRRRVHHVRG